MAIYKKGSYGADVVKIQKDLQTVGHYDGNADGDFGGGTESAVKEFQTSIGLTADGVVGPTTLAKLHEAAVAATPVDEPVAVPESVPDSPPEPVDKTPVPEEKEEEPEQESPPSTDDLAAACLALVGTIETAKMPPGCFASSIGDFDGQGMSFGALQWNLGQGTLQPLLKKMLDNNPTIVKNIFGANADLLRSVVNNQASAKAFAKVIQRNNKLIAPWSDMFTKLGLTKEFQEIEIEAASYIYEKATAMCQAYGLTSKRGRALMFDICVQNGSIRNSVKADIYRHHYTGIDEVSKMQIIANAIADAANPAYANDVRARKLTIANGKGIIHQTKYDLATQFGLDLTEA